jgi:hypothetical protein
MRVIKLTESDLKHVIRRVIQTEQDEENNPKMTTLSGLRAFSRGEISKDELYQIDDTIELIETRHPLAQSILTIKYEDYQELSNLINMSEDDLWFYRLLHSYDGYEFYSSYTVQEDFFQGYGIWDEIDEENRNKLKSIGEIIIPDKPFNIEDDGYRIQFNELLYELFEKEIDNILYDYEIEKNAEMNKTALSHVKSEFNEELSSVGIVITDDYDLNEFEITVADLYANALQWNFKTENAKEMLTSIIESVTKNAGGWYDMSYEFHDFDNFDVKSYNTMVGRNLDEIIDKLEEGTVSGISDYIKLRNNVLTKYKLDVWYDLPSDKSTKFKVIGFEPEELKVKLQILPKGDTHKMTKLNLSEEGFNNFLYQKSLFDFEDTY